MTKQSYKTCVFPFLFLLIRHTVSFPELDAVDSYRDIYAMDYLDQPVSLVDFPIYFQSKEFH